MMGKCGFLAAIRLVVLFLLIFSLVLSSLAVPSTRSLKSSEENPTSSSSSLHGLLLTEDAMDMTTTDGEELLDFISGRMDLESTDYPGTGANNHHDPRTPGRA